MRLEKWGNSLAVRLPVAVIEELGLKEGDDIQVTVKAKDRMEVDKKRGVEDMLATLDKYSGRVPLDFKFDRSGVNARQSECCHAQLML